MRIGKVEIAESTIVAVMLLATIMGMFIIVGKLDIEQEKTEQLKIELEIEQQKNSRGRV